MSSPPVPVVSPPEPPRPLTLVCANCHADLGGEYCAACGQRHEPHIHTVAHFAGKPSRASRTPTRGCGARSGTCSRARVSHARVLRAAARELPAAVPPLPRDQRAVLPGRRPAEGVAIEIGVEPEPTAERVEETEAAAAAREKVTGQVSEKLRLAAAKIEQQADRRCGAEGRGVSHRGRCARSSASRKAVQGPERNDRFCDEFNESGSPATRTTRAPLPAPRSPRTAARNSRRTSRTTCRAPCSSSCRCSRWS